MGAHDVKAVLVHFLRKNYNMQLFFNQQQLIVIYQRCQTWHDITFLNLNTFLLMKYYNNLK